MSAEKKLKSVDEKMDLIFRQPAKKKPRSKHITIRVPKANGAKAKRVPIEEKALAEIAAALATAPLKADEPEPEPEPVNVAESLARSAAEMLRFHQIDRTRRPGRQVDMKACAVEARRLRVEADEADPEHTDPAWANDKVPSSEIVAFFDRYIQGH